MELERLGPYQIVGKLGRGGMGTVYEAVHRETGEPAAVKLLSAALAQEEGFRSRFEAEIETLRKLNHPNIVRLFGFGEQEGQLFYAMELVDGNSIEEELRRGRRFEWREVTRIGIETCRALRHAHDRGIIHRDIKPGNLLVAAGGHVKLSDFGIARLFGYSRLTSAGSILGTAEYMAPEQAEGRPVDGRADLYSLGALMYTLLARRPVFPGKSLPEMLHKQRFEQPEPIRKYAPDTPEELERILGQLLEKDPGRRFPNADSLALRLEAMVHALSLGSETMEADKSWFLPDPSASPSEAAPAAISPDELPATQLLSQNVGQSGAEPFSRLQTAEAPSSPGENSLPPSLLCETTPPPLPGNKKPAETARPPLPSSRFVVVSEEELGDVEEEEPRPAMFSWQTGALVAVLVSLGFAAWWLLQPPTADRLYDRIASKTADGSINSIRDAEDDIHQFLDLYSNDRRADGLRKFQTEIDLDRMQREFDSPLKRLKNTKALQPIERAYTEAMNYAQLDPEIGMAKLQAILDLYNREEQDSGPTDQERCLILVKRRLDQLRGEMKKRVTEQLTLLQERLAYADEQPPADPQRAKIYRAVVELYGQKPWAAEAVRHARQALQPEAAHKP